MIDVELALAFVVLTVDPVALTFLGGSALATTREGFTAVFTSAFLTSLSATFLTVELAPALTVLTSLLEDVDFVEAVVELEVFLTAPGLLAFGFSLETCKSKTGYYKITFLP